MKTKELRDAAREAMSKYCKMCPVCDGRACAGQVPGIGGALTGSSFVANAEALKDVRINLRVVHGAVDPSTKINFLGNELATPIMAAPMTGAEYNCGTTLSEEEFVSAVVLGAEKAGSLGWIGDAASLPLFEAGIRAAAKAKKTVAIIKPRNEFDEVIKRFRAAEEAGAVALGMDLDGAGLVTMRLQGQPVGPKTQQQIKAFRASTKLPFIIKGIMTPDEAQLCLDAGVDCIVVSNHGGRVLDGCPGVAEALPEIAYSMKGKLTILADGAVRSGVDALKLMALGASGVLLGRPVCWGAYGNGVDGVADIIANYTAELYQAMIMTGCQSADNIPDSVLF